MSGQGHSQTEDPRIGVVLLDRYRIVSKLGEGGMGDVYEGVHELIGKKLAIKCMHIDFAANAEAVRRFRQEARAATAVGNEHIVDVSDMGDLPDGSPFMVMEHLKGCELAGLIRDHSPLPVSRVIRIALQILEALSAAHQQGVVHRDMKPENVFLIERSGDPDFVKVLDFGISMIAEHADASKGRMTQTGVAMGTPNYMSPEQAKGARDVDLRTDLYSVGVILYEALTNTVPFESGSLAVLMTKILMEPPCSIRRLRDDVPPELDRIILRAMAKEADVRFESAEEFSDALRPFQDPGYEGRPSPQPISRSNATVKLTGATATPALDVDSTAQLPFAKLGNAGDPERTALVDPDTSATASGAPTAPSAMRRWLLPAGVVLGGALAGLLILGSGSESAQELQEPELPLPKPSVGTAVQAPLQTPVVKEVRVQITALPTGAKVYVDGAPFPNSLQVSRPRSMASTRIQVVLDGYQAVDTVTVFDQDRTLRFELEKSPLAVKAPSTAVIKKGGRKSTPTSKSKTDPTTKQQSVATDEKTSQPPTKNKDPSVYTGSSGTVRDEF